MFLRKNKMKIIFLSSNIDTIEEWKKRNEFESVVICYDLDSLTNELNVAQDYIIIADYDTVAHDVNKLISSNKLPEHVIVLERTPEIATGKMLISHGVKAYGNARMLRHHFTQMIQTVMDEKIWTYPELTASLAQRGGRIAVSEDARVMIKNRLTQKEEEVLYSILSGLTNDAIAEKLKIKTRTVKAHISSIFEKLHVNDRLSLVLLLK